MAPEGVFAEKDRGQVHGRWPEVADNLGGWSLDATEPTDEAGRDVFAYMVFEKGLHGANCCTGDRMDKSCV